MIIKISIVLTGLNIFGYGAPEDRKIMLDTQFRCPSMISDFVSEAFYEGKYFAGVGMDKKQPLLSYCPQPMIWIDTTWLQDKAEKATSEDGRAVVQDNVCEAKLVIALLKSSIKEMPGSMLKIARLGLLFLTLIT